MSAARETAVPELPEVETLRGDAERWLVGRRIRGVEVLAPEVIRHPQPEAFPAELQGATFAGARRRAKHLFLDLDNGKVLALQLALFGQLLLRDGDAAAEPEALAVMRLEDGAALHVLDRSRYTRLHLDTPQGLDTELHLGELGPEPLAPEFSAGLLQERLGRKRARLKGLLLDQRVLSGLGNIYVDEALWRARLHPARPANRLSAGEWRALHAGIQGVLREAIANRGTTFHTYRDLLGAKGHHQASLAVFHRQGEPCPRCGTSVERITVASRDTHICPRCQNA
jgi:formamidopyrimidine-DNA glycosylase